MQPLQQDIHKLCTPHKLRTARGMTPAAAPNLIWMHSRLVSKSTDKGSEEHRGSEARDEQLPDLSWGVAVMLVESVNIRALQPVTHCSTAERSWHGAVAGCL